MNQLSDKALENNIQGVFRGIDVEVDTESVESCQGRKETGNNGKVVLKHSKTKDADEIKQKKLEHLYHIKLGCFPVQRNFSKRKGFFFETSSMFRLTNGTVKIKLLNDQAHSVAYEVDLSALTDECPLVCNDRNE